MYYLNPNNYGSEYFVEAESEDKACEYIYNYLTDLHNKQVQERLDGKIGYYINYPKGITKTFYKEERDKIFDENKKLRDGIEETLEEFKIGKVAYTELC